MVINGKEELGGCSGSQLSVEPVVGAGWSRVWCLPSSPRLREAEMHPWLFHVRLGHRRLCCTLVSSLEEEKGWRRCPSCGAGPFPRCVHAGDIKAALPHSLDRVFVKAGLLSLG